MSVPEFKYFYLSSLKFFKDKKIHTKKEISELNAESGNVCIDGEIQAMEDKETKAVVLVGKADSIFEQMAAEYYKNLSKKKPIIAFVAGESLPFGKSVGYAGDIITRGRITVKDKKNLMKDAGIIVVDNISQISTALVNLGL